MHIRFSLKVLGCLGMHFIAEQPRKVGMLSDFKIEKKFLVFRLVPQPIIEV